MSPSVNIKMSEEVPCPTHWQAGALSVDKNTCTSGVHSKSELSELKCEIQFIELFIPSENSQIFYGFPAAHVAQIASSASAGLVTSKLQPSAAKPLQQKGNVGILLCSTATTVNTGNIVSTGIPPKRTSEKQSIVHCKNDAQNNAEKIKASLRDIHSYSSPDVDKACDQDSSCRKKTEMSQLSTVSSSLSNSFQPVVKIEPVTEEIQCEFSWNQTGSGSDKINKTTSQKKPVVKSNKPSYQRNYKTMSHPPGASSRSALEELLLSDIGCPPNKQVVAEHFRNLGKGTSKMAKSRSVGSAFQDISNSKRCSSSKRRTVPSKSQTVTRPAHQKTTEKKMCKKRSLLSCGLVNEQRSHLSQTTNDARTDSIKLEGALEIFPPAGYGLPCTPSNLEMAKNLSLSPSNLSPCLVLKRKESIQQKLSSVSSMPFFTQEEEFDVHCRAEAYVNCVMPDPDYCVVREEETIKHIFPFEDKENTNYPGCQIPGTSAGNVQVTRKRRKHLSIIDSYLTFNPYSRYYPQLANCVTLSDGCQLLKPPVKLVELVAQAINDSPDGMLQVQQVYHCIQKRYPFFQYLDRTSMTSWRSSIRHALYQKWFRKLQFDIDHISSKGCYWGINRRNRPKEWAMPPNTGQAFTYGRDYPSYSPEFLQTFGDFENLKSVELVEIDDEDIMESVYARDELLDNPVVSMDCLSPSLKITGSHPAYRSRDPDPMLTQPGPLSQDLSQSILNVDGQVDSFDLETPGDQTSEASAMSPFNWQSDSEENSFSSSLAWIPSFDDDCNDSNLPMLGSGECLGMTDLPDIETLEPDQVSMCLQKTYPHDEHW